MSWWGHFVSRLCYIFIDSTEWITCSVLTCFYREHLIRLQHENKMLKLAHEGSDNEKIALLQSLLEDANRRKSELETENRLALSTPALIVLVLDSYVTLKEMVNNKNCPFIAILTQKVQNKISLPWFFWFVWIQERHFSVGTWIRSDWFEHKDFFLFYVSFCIC